MTESGQIQLPEDLELQRQGIGNLPVDKRKNLYAALQNDENKDIKVSETPAGVNNELFRFTKEMGPSVSGVTRSDKVGFIKQGDNIPVYAIK